MASKNEAKQCTKRTSPRTTLASPSTPRNPEGDIRINTDTNKNNDNACLQASKLKKREIVKKVDDKALIKSRTTLESELAEKLQRVDSLEVQLEGLQENLRAEQAQKKANKELYEETKGELTKAQEELRDFAGIKQTYSN